jgi:hypothetical protein
MRPEDITIDSTADEVCRAIERGEFTWDDYKAQVPRLEAQSKARKDGALKAIDLVQVQDVACRSRRVSKAWRSKYIVGGDKSRFYLVTCGRGAWHVDPETWAIKRIH